MINSNYLLNKAIKIASVMQNKKQNIVAIISNKKGHLISIGKNSYSKTSPFQAYYAKKCGCQPKIFLHAEIDALIHCKDKPHTIYVARVNKKSQPLPAKPCPICSMAIKDAGIKRIITT